MNAIFDIAGKQYAVEKNQLLTIDRVSDDTTETIEFDRVLLVKDSKDVKIGQPFVKGAVIRAKIVDNVRDKKVYAFKYRKRKDSKRIRGHKQHYTIIKIEDIILN